MNIWYALHRSVSGRQRSAKRAKIMKNKSKEEGCGKPSGRSHIQYHEVLVGTYAF